MDRGIHHFETRFARTARDREAAARLRYKVFVRELGGDGPEVDHAAQFESDTFDPHCSHLLLIDRRRDQAALEDVIGVYRLLDEAGAAAAGGFYSETEYDLTRLRASGKRLLELGRSCLHPDYRGGPAMYHIWNALAEHVVETGVDVLFGVASFHGTDPQALAQPLSLLHHKHLAPEPLRVRALPRHFQRMDLCPADSVDRPAAIRAVPALIKAYLRLGGVVGEGAFVDHAFNTTDVCVLLDTATINRRTAALYGAGA